MNDKEFRVLLLKGELPEHPDPSRGCIRRGFCCRTNPGWFGPGEVDGAAKLKGMTTDDFVRQYCVIDGIEVDGQLVEVFAPVKIGRAGPIAPPGSRVDDLYKKFPSTCVFFDGSGCGIYGARPVECRRYICTNKPADNPTKEEVARLWMDG